MLSSQLLGQAKGDAAPMSALIRCTVFFEGAVRAYIRRASSPKSRMAFSSRS
jgi:hypothetical protein